MFLLNRLQLIQNSLAHAVVKAPKFSRSTPIFKYLHWLKVTMQSQSCMPETTTTTESH